MLNSAVPPLLDAAHASAPLYEYGTDPSRSDTQLPDNGGVSGAAYWLRAHPQRSGRNSRIHSAPALAPVSHHPPALWAPLRRVLVPIVVVAAFWLSDAQPSRRDRGCQDPYRLLHTRHTVVARLTSTAGCASLTAGHATDPDELLRRVAVHPIPANNLKVAKLPRRNSAGSGSYVCESFREEEEFSIHGWGSQIDSALLLAASSGQPACAAARVAHPGRRGSHGGYPGRLRR